MICAMPVLLTIGDFSRMTYLSVKALRHYHDIGLLAPADVDPATGYRLYLPSQVPTAQVIRRFRDLGMPLETVKAVLDAPDVASRNASIVEHLQRMEQQLEQTQTTVASLRVLLEQTPVPIEVEYRSAPALHTIAVRGRVAMSDGEQWWGQAFDELHAALASTQIGAHRSGPDGALYWPEFFQADAGEVVAFIPVVGDPHPVGRARPFDLPSTELAVTVHEGPFGDLDKTYGALGTFVAERALGVDGPIRENYLVTPTDTDDETAHRTEVCWPVFHTTSRRTESQESRA
jgi:DNA-binding transcriptional MerR regulator